MGELMDFINGDTHMSGMGLWWLVFIAIVVMVFVLATWNADARNKPSNRSAEEILKQRFAAGDIDKAEYDARLQELRK
jgi:uncharacterized membrane protein